MSNYDATGKPNDRINNMISRLPLSRQKLFANHPTVDQNDIELSPMSGLEAGNGQRISHENILLSDSDAANTTIASAQNIGSYRE